MNDFWAMAILANLWLCTALIQNTQNRREGKFAFLMGLFWMIIAVVLGGN